MTETKVPACIGIILDGNRRWAKERGLPSLEGHRQGAERVAATARLVRDRGIPHLAIYAFSTENWGRPAEEVSYLMKLFSTMASEVFSRLADENIRIRFIGQRERFDAGMQALMQDVEERSAQNSALTLWVCLSYGGRAEIAAAAQKAAAEGEVTEASLGAHLWTTDMPDADIIIRTGGEKRLSGFLTWRSVYAELFFINAYWPDFDESILDSILTEYAKRERRMGK